MGRAAGVGRHDFVFTNERSTDSWQSDTQHYSASHDSQRRIMRLLSGSSPMGEIWKFRTGIDVRYAIYDPRFCEISHRILCCEVLGILCFFPNYYIGGETPALESSDSSAPFCRQCTIYRKEYKDMYDISNCHQKSFNRFISERLIDPNSVYDFTFEDRYLVYHTPLQGDWVYYVLDVSTQRTSEALRSKKPLIMSNPRDFIPHIYNAIKYTGDCRYVNNMAKNPLNIIDSIFRIVLAENGYTVREDQIELSKRIYKGLTGYPISLYEAEVGTGKSMAYLVAAVVARKSNDLHEPITISTATVELQRALIEKEIPRLSKILMDYQLIDQPLTTVIRKGKEHYFCRFRYEDYLSKIRKYPEKYNRLLQYFAVNDFAHTAFDLDLWKISGTLKSKICVKGRCFDCKYKHDCKYNRYIDFANHSPNIVFQVTNHNLFLTSEQLHKFEAGRLLRPSQYVIIDEAHKLRDAAQDIYGEYIDARTIPKYLNLVRFLCRNNKKQDDYRKLLQTAAKLNEKLFSYTHGMVRPEDQDSDNGTIFKMKSEIIILIKELIAVIKAIETSRIQVASPYGIGGDHIITALHAFTKQKNILTWATLEENGMVALCCCPKNIGKAMRENLWHSLSKFVLLSGTISDGKNFSYFIKENGLSGYEDKKMQVARSRSPFDYAKNTRLYIPIDMPTPDSYSNEDYIRSISDRIVSLVQATNGHTAILFTSYKALHAVYTMTKEHLADYQLICMTRNNKTAISDFKKSKNAILFASGSMWEGVDCMGDLLSSVIIVRLPFPIRSATMEQKKSASANVTAFIDEYAVPEMLIKLRQGVGRLIRSETDTGLISILDSRAAKSQYAERVQRALSKYPQINSITEIEQFFQEVKPNQYFEK